MNCFILRLSFLKNFLSDNLGTFWTNLDKDSDTARCVLPSHGAFG